MSGRQRVVALLLGLAACGAALDQAEARRRGSDDPPAPAVAAPAQPQSESDQIAQRLAQGASAYMSASPSNSGWRLAGDIKAAATADGATSVKLADLAYVLSEELSIVFPSVDIRIKQDKAKDKTEVAILLAGEPSLRRGQSVVGRLTLGKHVITGDWDPRREAFSALKVRLEEVSAKLSNGTNVTFGELNGRFTTEAGGGSNRTVQFTGTISADTVVARAGDERWRASAQSGRLELGIKDLDTSPAMTLNYSHELVPGRYNGVAGEIVPLSFSMVGKIWPFPWGAALRELPPWLADVAAKAAPDPGFVWGGLWRRLIAVLGASDLAIDKVEAKSKGLTGLGKGDVKFIRNQEPRGNLLVDLRGINERIANLERSERKEDPMLYPSLALMTVIGDGRNDNGARVHRFKVEMNGGQIRVNGRDTAGLKPEP